MKKNQIIDRKIKSCQIDLIWNLLLDLTWFIFAVFDVKSFWLLIFMWQGKRALELLGSQMRLVPTVPRIQKLVKEGCSVLWCNQKNTSSHENEDFWPLQHGIRFFEKIDISWWQLIKTALRIYWFYLIEIKKKKLYSNSGFWQCHMERNYAYLVHRA